MTKSSKSLLVLMVCIIALTGFYLLKNQSSEHKYKVVKAGAGSSADFTMESTKLHSAVDSALNKAKLISKYKTEANKEIKRQKLEGSIKWHTRQLLVNLPPEISLEKFRQILNLELANEGEVITAEPDYYQGLAVERLDIGIHDTLEGDDITIITDRLYIAKNNASVKVRGQMAIVIDDFGYSYEPIAEFAAIRSPLTFSVLPYRPYSNQAAASGLSSGHQVIVHLPMEPLNKAEQSEGKTISTNMSDAEIKQMTNNAITAIPGIIGVNNHQGSRATADKRVMMSVLEVLKAHNLFFLDSRTNSQSIAVDTAINMGVQVAANKLFIDNSNNVNDIKDKLKVAKDMAIRNSSVVVIGHARINTAEAIRQMIPEIEAAGIQLVFVSTIAQKP